MARYFFDESSGKVSFIDGNPRLVEPVNALMNGTNLADVLARVSLGEKVERMPPGRSGVKTHMALMAVLAAATDRPSRSWILGRLREALAQKSDFSGSREELTPVGIDSPSGIALAAAVARLLVRREMADRILRHAVGSYSLSDEAVRTINAVDLVATFSPPYPSLGRPPSPLPSH